MQIIEKPWGKEEVVEINERYMMKKLTMWKGHRCSLQYHEHKTETVYVLSGTLLLHLDGLVLTMKSGDFITILPKEIHRMEGGEDVVYLESSTPELDDVIRVEDDYGR